MSRHDMPFVFPHRTRLAHTCLACLPARPACPPDTRLRLSHSSHEPALLISVPPGSGCCVCPCGHVLSSATSVSVPTSWSLERCALCRRHHTSALTVTVTVTVTVNVSSFVMLLYGWLWVCGLSPPLAAPPLIHSVPRAPPEELNHPEKKLSPACLGLLAAEPTSVSTCAWAADSELPAGSIMCRLRHT